MGSVVWLFLLVVSIHIYIIAAATNPDDASALRSLMDEWKNLPSNWGSGDPCDDKWVGTGCRDSRVISLKLPGMKLEGRLTGDVFSLSELQELDLSYNEGIGGSLPPTIGNLKNLINLILVGCGFFGPIPDTIGSLPQLRVLSLNSNGFTGPIPRSIGNLSNLYWLDLADNQLHGEIPVSDGPTTPGLDWLIHTKHFHFGKNQLSGPIPSKLFSSEMTLIHLLLESNRLSGALPSTLGLVKSLEVVRFDNNSLNGVLPSNLNNLTSVHDLFLSNNRLTGPLPNLTGMSSLNTLYLSNNSFNSTDVPSWFPALASLTTLVMENTQLTGQIPASFFNLQQLQTVVLKHNNLDGSLDIGPGMSNQLEIIDLQSNSITDFNITAGEYTFEIILVDNPVCRESGATNRYCTLPPPDSSPFYSTPPQNCQPYLCSSDQISSPRCRCAYPFTGKLQFRGLFFSNLQNRTPFESLEQDLTQFFKFPEFPVDSVSLRNPRMDPYQYLLLDLELFPYGEDRFNKTGISAIASAFSSQDYKPPDTYFGPYVFRGDSYEYFSDGPAHSSKSIAGIAIGAAAGASVLFVLLILAGIYAYRQRKRAERATLESNPFAHWDPKKSSGSIPQLKGARCFGFEELKKYTNNFTEANDIGSGGYGKVYRGTLPTGELVAIKRAQQGSLQGGVEFKTEIELLSRVHHKNVVSLLGFCFELGEQILIYEYVPNGSLSDSLSGKSGIRLDWSRRLKIALGAARGVAYLHELANPPIIHRDIKSTNILLDERLNAKVADFGLSKPMGDSEKGHVSTQVKGTMGYLDPEYYMTQQLTEKSDVYSFGVLMLEIVTARRPIERGKYIVREVRMLMDKTKSSYNLQQILDPSISFGTSSKGLERFVDLAMRCVEESGADRPTMGEMVKVIEDIMQMAGMNPNAESAASSATYEDAAKGSNPYGDESFAYSGGFPMSVTKIEPH
ncbi:putative leucine-rich repeat receptor-like protein kinase [Hibiscus syriacus]|uniref:non-specific serine/threonine protein kinase n=1 Tax=Hibiscus syriacus TaxID=106335 RepID=A0A6A3AUY3_HIBSY|nr:probable leucine-rich repeat receptor-like protein kinase At5g49770 [Hibiscus syriacus]KAE8707543.1 putative leucine-rich repeat receptor-like protein kinase [Hibiscus syriacus]